MEVFFVDIFAAIFINILHCAYSEHILSCDEHIFKPCPEVHMRCNATSKLCECTTGFVRVGDVCEPTNDEYTPPKSATAAIITIFALALIISGLVLVIRKYNLVEYVRKKINARRNNEVLYEDVMIGNDDPPLSP